MKKLFAVVVAGLFVWAPAGAKDQAKGQKVKYQVRDGHLVSKKSTLKKDASYLAFADARAFKKVFGNIPPVARKKFTYVNDDDFKSGMVVAVIKQGRGEIAFKVNKVTAADGKLFVQYKAVPGPAYRTKFPSLLVVVVDQGKYNSVVFLENGKKVKTTTIKK